MATPAILTSPRGRSEGTEDTSPPPLQPRRRRNGCAGCLETAHSRGALRRFVRGSDSAGPPPCPKSAHPRTPGHRFSTANAMQAALSREHGARGSQARTLRGSGPRTAASGQSRERRPSFARTTARVSGYRHGDTRHPAPHARPPRLLRRCGALRCCHAHSGSAACAAWSTMPTPRHRPRCSRAARGMVARTALEPLALAGLRPASFALRKTAHSRGALRRFVRGSVRRRPGGISWQPLTLTQPPSQTISQMESAG